MQTTQVLVVEDENIVARDILTMLKGLGYGVAAVASSGEEAIEKAAAKQPDVDRKSTRLNSSHIQKSRMPSSA